MEEERHYILFPSHTEGMKLEKILSCNNIAYTITPTPRELLKCCGIAVMYNKIDEDRIKKLIKINDVKILGIHSLKKKIVNPYL